MSRRLILFALTLLLAAGKVYAGETLVAQSVLPLPGGLNDVLMFNSNSPEIVQKEGVLLSTFPPVGKLDPAAHLDFPMKGKFNIFVHHIARALRDDDLRTLHVGIIVYNPGKTKLTLTILQAASYLSQPDAPFVPLRQIEENPDGKIYSGPGDRVTDDVLRGWNTAELPAKISVAPGEYAMLADLPIPVRELRPALNGRSTLIRLKASNTVYIASLGLFAPRAERGDERSPSLSEWRELLEMSGVAGPRDRTPTPPKSTRSVIYGRVAGVQRGSRWTGTVVDEGMMRLTVPEREKAKSFVLSTVENGTFGTGQVQSAPLVVRYPDTAYAAHGNYCVEYDLTMPLYNPGKEPRQVNLLMQTPVKTDRKEDGLLFKEPPTERVFYRGTVRVQYVDENGGKQERFVHLVQHQGERAEPLVTLTIRPHGTKTVKLSLLYPPDATPPQVLTVESR